MLYLFLVAHQESPEEICIAKGFHSKPSETIQAVQPENYQKDNQSFKPLPNRYNSELRSREASGLRDETVLKIRFISRTKSSYP